MKKLIAAITLFTFISTSTSISTAFAADEAPARPTTGTAESSQYEIRSYEPEAVEAEEAEEAEEDTTAEDIATSESTKAFIAGTNIKIIEGALFVTGLVVMAVALSGGGSSGHGD